MSLSGGMNPSLLDALEMNRCLGRLREQYLERRDVGVPFYERRHGAEARQCLDIERPHRRRHPRAMVVDTQHLAVVELTHRVPGEMDLADGGSRQGGEIRARIPAMVAGTHVDIVDVAQDAAAGTLGNGGEELPLRNRRVREAQVR